MKVDITSDLHIDFWVDPVHMKNQSKHRELISVLVSNLLPEEPSDTLIIAGDIGHYNNQNVILFEVLKETYKDIIWVHGNHDLYMVSNNIEKKYNYDSFMRLDEMVKLSSEIEGVHYLNGDTIQLGGYIIGGCGAWYDNGYGSSEWGMSDTDFIKRWREYLNDSNLINVPFTRTGEIHSLEYAEKMKAAIDSIVDVCDLMVTHVAPDWTHVPPHYQQPETTFYCFDGREFLKRMKPDAKWVFGHTHERHFFSHPSGPYMICNPLGYPMGQDIRSPSLERCKFATVDMDAMTSYEDLFNEEYDDE